MIVGATIYDEIQRKDRPSSDLLQQYGEEFGFPVLRIPTFGHAQLENPAIPIGAAVRISASDGSVELTSEVVDR